MSSLDPAPAALRRRLPRLIHQTFGIARLPDSLRRNVDELVATNPTWEHRLYDDAAIEAFIAEHYGTDMLARYHRIDPLYGPARADLFRYLLIYRVGGVYLDIKSRFSRPIDEVISGDESFIVSQWSNRPGERYEGFGLKPEVAHVAGGEFQQWHVIGEPGHPFLAAVIDAVLSGIDRYRPWRDGTGKVGVTRLTGPLAYTLAIQPIIDRHPCRIVSNENALSLEYSVLNGDGHRDLVRRHYSTARQPIIRPSGVQRIANSVFTLARAFRGFSAAARPLSSTARRDHRQNTIAE